MAFEFGHKQAESEAQGRHAHRKPHRRAEDGPPSVTKFTGWRAPTPGLHPGVRMFLFKRIYFGHSDPGLAVAQLLGSAFGGLVGDDICAPLVRLRLEHILVRSRTRVYGEAAGDGARRSP